MTEPRHGGLSGYTTLLGPTDRRVLFAAGVTARIPLAVVGFSVLFFVQATSGSFAVAGFASGLAVAAMAGVSPVFGRIADRRGQKGALLVAAIGHPLAIALLIALGLAGASLPFVSIGALLVGATIAPVGAFMRARWSAMLGATPSLQVAFSLEAIADELVWVFGPALASLVSGLIDPAAGLVISAVFGTVGSLWLRRGDEVEVVAAPASGRRHVFVPWRSRRIVALLLSNAALGVVFGINDVSVVSWTTSAGVPQIAGLVLTAYSIGSVTGGFLMGMVPARIPAYRMLIVSCAALGIFWGALSLAPGPSWLFLFGLFAGATITPFTISTNRVLHDETPPAVFTEGLAWVSAFVVGAMALGSFLGGVIDQQVGPSAGFGLLAFLAPIPFVIVVVVAILPGGLQRPVVDLS
ncbi:MFS transporter [Frondihabitans peucedani]|uniref:MFS transporter n=1 Tax=Frondihabitans peucedani TaxID=598626 RepID=A0ABP8E247_9MICO